MIIRGQAGAPPTRCPEAREKPVRRRVQVAIDGFGECPRPSGGIVLQGLRGAYRLRVGDHLVIYTIDDNRLVVLVVDLGHRPEIYPDL
jgi:mRNA interferase RelE/StbE